MSPHIQYFEKFSVSKKISCKSSRECGLSSQGKGREFRSGKGVGTPFIKQGESGTQQNHNMPDI